MQRGSDAATLAFLAIPKINYTIWDNTTKSIIFPTCSKKKLADEKVIGLL